MGEEHIRSKSPLPVKTKPDPFHPENSDDEEVPDENVPIFEDEVDMPNMEEEYTDALSTFRSHKDDVLCCDFHPNDSKVAATGGMDDKVYVWDFSNPEPKVVLEVEFQDSVDAIKFSPCGQFLGMADLRGNIKVYQTKDWTLHLSRDTEGDSPRLVWHSTAPVMIAIFQSHVFVVNVVSKEMNPLIWSYEGVYLDGKILPDGKRMAIVSDQGTISIVDLLSTTVVGSANPKTLNGTEYSIICLDVKRDGSNILCGCADGTIFSYVVGTSKITLYPHGTDENEVVEGIGFSQTERYKNLAASVHNNGIVRFWDTTKAVVRNECITELCVTNMVWHHSAPILFTSHFGGVALMIDGRTGNLLRKIKGHAKTIMHLALSLSGSFLLTASADYKARVFFIDYDEVEDFEVPALSCTEF